MKVFDYMALASAIILIALCVSGVVNDIESKEYCESRGMVFIESMTNEYCINGELIPND